MRICSVDGPPALRAAWPGLRRQMTRPRDRASWHGVGMHGRGRTLRDCCRPAARPHPPSRFAHRPPTSSPCAARSPWASPRRHEQQRRGHLVAAQTAAGHRCGPTTARTGLRRDETATPGTDRTATMRGSGMARERACPLARCLRPRPDGWPATSRTRSPTRPRRPTTTPRCWTSHILFLKRPTPVTAPPGREQPTCCRQASPAPAGASAAGVKARRRGTDFTPRCDRLSDARATRTPSGSRIWFSAAGYRGRWFAMSPPRRQARRSTLPLADHVGVLR